ncbi:hypothetical protein M501DRAFT_990049 [Patellaria atrata CBS 101060]|uniref:Ras modification protein ERF4 n=1 Tax=Patellaria atrata CBS 101060 TaxID=1346257 RepID=A0A9P4SEV4_9PEZI|nr:hypothetical protein M501DRAFT_990049 [Patellaria atrata CBS 101060]
MAETLYRISPSPTPNALPQLPRPTHPPPPSTTPSSRWSLTNRIFFSWRNSLPRAPSSRLWNPINNSPRALAIPNVPISHPQIAEGGVRPAEGRDEYPLLTLPEQRRSKTSGPGSLIAERSTGGESGRTSVGVPSNRRSVQLDDPQRGSAHPPPMEDIGVKLSGIEDPDLHVLPSPASDDVEAGPGQRGNNNRSKASLPLSRRASQSTHPGTIHHDDEFAWGPSHPCYPHQNPHVPLSSPLASSTRIIRVKRDWMVAGDLVPQFSNLYPEILEPYVASEAYWEIIKKINTELKAAFTPMSGRAFVDALMGVATLWLWEDAGMTGVKKKLRALEDFLEKWNKDVGEKEGIKIIPLRRTAYLTLDFQIPNPHITDESRPATDDRTQTPTGAVPPNQAQGNFAPYPVQSLSTLHQTGQTQLPAGVKLEGR